ncbi:MAG: hypothetical protein AAB388_01575 [Patescibacteria group bacterium]|mgnify:CR=1 FL=1
MLEKLKSWLIDDAVFHVLVVLLVGIGSFGLGRQSALDSKPQMNASAPANVAIATSAFVPVEQPVEVKATTSLGPVVASKSGTKYHLPSCPGASQIKEANRIEFASLELAEAAGYTPAANCSGL